MEDAREKVAVVFVQTAMRLPEPTRAALIKQSRKVYDGERTFAAVLMADNILSGSGFYKNDLAFWRGAMFAAVAIAEREGILIPKHAMKIAGEIDCGDRRDILRFGIETTEFAFSI
jgi:hypothetical protein